ncbi:ARM repeat superfamily protein, partial [Prunus dulcis]
LKYDPKIKQAKYQREREREMQKREQSKLGGVGGGASAPPAKRGRPFGSGGNSAAAAAAAAAETAAPSTLLGPSLHVHSSFADQNNKRIVLALQSGLKSELTWALNTLTLLSFKEKDDMRKDTTPLAKIPGLLDALLSVIDDWRDIALPKEHVKAPRVRNLGANLLVTGFGNEYEALGSNGTLHFLGKPYRFMVFSCVNFEFECLKSSLIRVILDLIWQYSHGSLGSSSQEASVLSNVTKLRSSSEWWLDEDGLFNLDEEGRAERQQCAVAASNIIRNFSFMPDNEVIMAQHRHCLETVFQCIEDYLTEDEELVTNALETIVNLAPLLDLGIFSSSKPSYIKITGKRAVQAIMGMLGSVVKTWHCAAAELLGRLIINPDNEPFLLPFVPQIHKRLVDLMSLPSVDAQTAHGAQAAAVGALYNLAEVNMDCRLKLASERWAIDRLLKVIKAPHPVPEVCRKAAMILESLVYSDTFARILYELTSRPNNKVAAARGVWGIFDLRHL